jgi:hypothetical protein
MKTFFGIILSVIGILTAGTFSGCSSEAEFAGTNGAPKENSDNALPQEPGTPPEETPVEQPTEETPAEPTDPIGPEPKPEPKKFSLEREFSPVTVEDIAADYNPEYQMMDQNVTLRELAPATLSVRQLERAMGQESFQQGRDAQRADPEMFSITEAGKLDLLVVMDDSTSMSQEQTNLASKLDPLISKLENTDWQIAVVTTSDPCLRGNRLIKKSDADRNTAFLAAVGDIVLSDTVIEKGFPMAIKALKGECKGVTNPWLRANAAVGILIVSDEDNCGSHAGEGCPGEQGETVAQMVDYLRSVRPADQGRIYGLFEGANECGTSAFTATKYKQGVDQTGGRWGSICQNDYTTTLTQISDDVRKIVKREFALKFPPDQGTLMLTVDGNAKTTGFSLNGNMLTVTDLSAIDQSLVVNYSYGAIPKYKIFKIAGNPDPSTLAVTVNNQPVGGNVSYDSAMQDIVFVNEPADNAVIRVSYRVNTPLPKEFSVAGTDILGAPAMVKVDGKAENAYTFDPNLMKIVFDQAPADGKSVDITFRTKGGRTTRYTAALTDLTTAKAITAVDKNSGMPVTVATAGNDLVFEADDVADGRMIVVRYDIGYKPEDLQFDLAHMPLGGAVTVGVSDPTCEKMVTVAGQEVRVDCGRGKAGTINLKYRAVTAVDTEFTIDADFPDQAEWKVTVDGVPVVAERNGKTISLPADLFSEGSKVKVIVNWEE